MSIAAFPSPTLSGSNPQFYRVFYKEIDQFKVSVSEYDDGGKDFALQAGGAGVQAWIIKWDCLSAAEAAIVDAHVNASHYHPDAGSAENFQFTDPDGNLFSNVHYAPGGFTRVAHDIRTVQAREIILVKYPN